MYFRMTDHDGAVYTSLITFKTRVAPRLELCGSHLLTKLLEHVRTTLKIPTEQVYTWTDSMIVMKGNPRRSSLVHYRPMSAENKTPIIVLPGPLELIEHKE